MMNARSAPEGAQPGPTAPRLARALEYVALGVACFAACFAFREFVVRYGPITARSGSKMIGVIGAFAVGAIASLASLRAVKRRQPLPIRTTLRRFFVALIFVALLSVPTGPAYTRLGIVAICGLAATVFTFQWLTHPMLSARCPRVLRAVEFVLFQLCITALLAEIALRGLAELRPSPVLTRAHQSVARNVAAARYAPGTVRFGSPTNSRGFPDEEFGPRRPGERRIAVIGDSFVVGVVPHYFHFTTVCERRTGANLFAVGLPGIGPLEYLHLVETELDSLDVDEVVISIFVGNDFVEADFSSRPHDLASDWLRLENLLVFETPRRLAVIWNESRDRGMVAGISQGELERAISTTDPAALLTQFPWLADHRLEVDGHSAAKFSQLETTRAIAVCRPTSAPPNAILGALRAIRERVGSTPLTMLVLPDEFQVEDALFAEVSAAIVSERLDRELPQRRLAEFFVREGIRFLDVLPHLRAAPLEDDGRRHVYHGRDTHLNRKGNEIVGQALADYLSAH